MFCQREKPINIEWTLCDIVLPPNDMEVLVIGYSNYLKGCRIYKTKFNSSIGWYEDDTFRVYAWKFLSDETDRLCKEATKKFKS